MFAVPACHTTHDLIRDISSSFMKSLQSLGICSVILAAAACARLEQRQPLATVAFVDLSRYSGTWYEIARLPMRFQRHCVDSKAIYTTRPDGTDGTLGAAAGDFGFSARIDTFIVDLLTPASSPPPPPPPSPGPTCLRYNPNGKCLKWSN